MQSYKTPATWQRAVFRVAVLLGIVLLTYYVLKLDAEAAKRAPANTEYDSLRSVNFAPYPPMIYPVRVGIGTRKAATRIAVWSPGAVFIDTTPIFTLQPGLVYQIANGRITEYATGRSVQLPRDKRTRIASRDYQVWCDSKWWRGSLEIIHFGNSLTVINLLDLENYLMGVVPSEMPSSWHLEALKAQAVAARSYAYAHMGANSKWFRSEGYDVVPDVRDQAYKGRAAEALSTDRAIRETQGIILKDSGRVKPGFYRAWVGDAMENLNIRRKDVPTSLLEKLTGVHQIVGVTVKQMDPNMNAHSIQVMGAKNSKEVYGIELAKRLGLSTAGILDAHENGANWTFTYRGPGNGSRGLSQHGADMLASRGWNFEQILRQYYQDNDGRLRLDYMDGYKAAAAAYSRPHTAPTQQESTDTE
ncbi:MAG TPA: SpoIID/LytB domain-containing protein [Drouetiella sp.]